MTNDTTQSTGQAFSATGYLIEQVAKQGPVALLLLGGLMGVYQIGNTHITTINDMWKERHTEQAAMIKGFQETLDHCCKEKRAVAEQRANGIASQ
jgi:hypothetical protein